MASDPRFGTEFSLDRLSSDLPTDDKLELCPIDALFDDIADQPLPTFLKSMKPIDALGLIPKVMVHAEKTYELAKSLNVEDPAVTSAKLSLDERAGILKYVSQDSTPSFYYGMNELCFTEERREQLKCFAPYMWLLMHALQKLPPYPEPKVQVHHIVTQNLLSQYPKGREFHVWSFLSTTKSIEVLKADAFSGPRTIFSITLRQQQARDISPFSLFPEGEVLLPPGCRFRVMGASEGADGLAIIDLEELPSEFYVLNLSPGAGEGS